MTALDINALSAGIGRYLRVNRASIMREDRIHDGIAAALGDMGVAVEREYRLNAAARLDFFLPDSSTAIEVKKDRVGLPILNQIGRYFESAKVAGCIVIAMRIDPKLPLQFSGKPIAYVSLWKFLL